MGATGTKNSIITMKHLRNFRKWIFTMKHLRKWCAQITDEELRIVQNFASSLKPHNAGAQKKTVREQLRMLLI